ncbi:hypothetical protein GQ457_02G025090 [Hibiscus cannabinus]
MVIWVRILCVLIRHMSESLGRSLGACIGTVVGTDTYIIDGNMGKFMWLRINIDTKKPLRCCVALGGCGNKPKLCPLQYEKLPNFSMKKQENLAPPEERIYFHEEGCSSNSHSDFSTLGEDPLFGCPLAPSSIVDAAPIEAIPVLASPPMVAAPLSAKTTAYDVVLLEDEEDVVANDDTDAGILGQSDVFVVDDSRRVHVSKNVLIGDENDDPSRVKRARFVIATLLLKDTRVTKVGMSSSKNSLAAGLGQSQAVHSLRMTSDAIELLDESDICTILSTDLYSTMTLTRIFLELLLQNLNYMTCFVQMRLTGRNEGTDFVLKIASSYFSDLLTSSSIADPCILEHILPSVFHDMNESLLPPFTAEEVVTAFHDIGLGKALGIDGFPNCFFRLHWDIVGPEFVQLCLALLDGSVDMASFGFMDSPKMSRNKTVVLGYVRDNVNARIASWNKHLLSFGGCEIFIKAVGIFEHFNSFDLDLCGIMDLIAKFVYILTYGG